MRDFIEGFAEVQKDYIHGPRTVTLTEHVLVKVKEVCNTRPTLTKTVLARFNEVVCLQKVDHPVLDDGLKDFSWDGSQADGSVIPCVRQKTLLGKGQTSADRKTWGTSAVVKDLLNIWQRCGTTPHATAKRTLGKKPSEPAALSGFISFNFASTSGSAQSMSVKVFSPAWTITGSGMLCISSTVKTLLN